MKLLETGLILYHGSYCAEEEPELDRCAKFKDFGRISIPLMLPGFTALSLTAGVAHSLTFVTRWQPFLNSGL